MFVLGWLLLIQAPLDAPLDAARMLHDRATEELGAENLESAQILLSLADWLAPDDELQTLEESVFRRLRASSSLRRRPVDLSAISDSPCHGLVARCPGTTRALRTAKKPGVTLVIDGEEFVIKGTSVRRKRKQPGEIESSRVVVVSDDETLVIEGRSLSVVERKAPGALAGRLLSSVDAREQAAGAMLHSLRSTIHALERLNDQRLAAGVPPVGFSAKLSYACFLHARYLANEEPTNTAGASMHEEAADSPWRTEEGASAARRSCISSYNLDCAVDQLMATLYHRVPMVAPELARVGIAQAEKDFRFYSVFDVMSGHEEAARRPVMVPGAGQTRVPVRLAHGEYPDPCPAGASGDVGYPVTLSWYGDLGATALLATSGGEEVDCWVSTPESPANAARPDNASTVCLLPKKPLRPRTKYTVTVTTAQQTWCWAFTTR